MQAARKRVQQTCTDVNALAATGAKRIFVRWEQTIRIHRDEGKHMCRKHLIRCIAASALWAGTVAVAHAGIFSAKGAVIAIAADDVYVGEAEGHLDGSGTVTIRSQKNPDFKCAGDFTSSAELGGAGILQCSDRTTAEFKFKRLTVYRGYGAATFKWGEMSFAYGFSPEEAARYLKLPTNKTLARNGTEIALIDR